MNYLGRALQNKEGWDEWKATTIANDNQALVAIDKCLERTTVIEVMILEENIYDMLRMSEQCMVGGFGSRWSMELK